MNTWGEFYDTATKEEVVEMLTVTFARAENYRELLGRIGLSFIYGRKNIEDGDFKELMEAASHWIGVTGCSPKDVEKQDKFEPPFQSKWVLDPPWEFYKCPQCKEAFSTDKHKATEMRYCPKCGAKNHYYPWET